MTVLVNTSRRDLPQRRALDAYYTPRATVERCLSVVEGTPSLILDPGAGEGVWGEVAREKWPSAFIRGVEVNADLPKPPAYDHWLTTDYLSSDFKTPTEHAPRFDLIIGNPPYSDGGAERFIRHSLPLLRFGGRLLFLLRLTFLEGHGRAEGLFKEWPPYCAWNVGRVSFVGCGNASPYGQVLMEWRQGHHGETLFRWLPAERKKKPRLRSESHESGAEKVGICKVDR